MTVLRLLFTVMIVVAGSKLATAQQAAVKLFAHRGGAYEYDENTMPAFRETYAKGIRGYETDIRISKDGHLFIFHDDDFKRLIGKEGSIETMTLKEIKALRTLKGNEIPTVDELLAFFKDKPGVYIEFEMKTSKTASYPDEILPQYCDQLYQKVKAAQPKGSEYIFTSFDKRPLKYLSQKYPGVDLLFIKGEGLSQAILDEAKEVGARRVGCNVHRSTRSMVMEAKKQGFFVTLWPGHSVDDFLLGVSLGSDYLCSDIPVKVNDWVKEKGSWITLK